MTIRQCTTMDDIKSMLAMAKDHPEADYDCTYEEFCAAVKTVLFPSPFYRAWLLCDGETALGYISASWQNFITRQVSIVDIFIRKEARGKGGGLMMLIESAHQWAAQCAVNRMTWRTRRNPAVWQRRLGVKLSEYRDLVWEGGR